ncbi:MAG: hypothetical protein WC476_13390 [Phycisphaerae bacterium]|jgi:hypothetical protein
MSEYERLTQNILGDNVIRLDMEFGYNPCEKCERFDECEDAGCEFALSTDRLAQYENIGSPERFAELVKVAVDMCETLEIIIDPLTHLRKEAVKEGKSLNGVMTLRLIDDPGYLRGIAYQALQRIKALEDKA